MIGQCSAGAEVDAASRGRVLVVEDNAPLRRLYERVLRRAEFLVEGVETLAAARERLAASVYSVVVSDLWLPDGSCLELVGDAHRADPAVPFLVVTASPSVDTAIGAIEQGVHRYLCKPLSADRLTTEVVEAAEVARLARMRRGQAAPSDADLSEPLSEALDQLWLAAQPIVRVSTREVHAYEILLRSSSSRLPTPDDMIKAAERTRRVVELGRRVRFAAAAQAALLAPGRRLFVNLHPAEILDPDLCGAHDPLRPFAELLTFEVTERAQIDGVPGIRDAVDRVRHAGCQIALDDLGGGYAGLTTLANLAPHVVKLDMALVRGIDRDPVRATLVRAVIDLCRELGIQVVGEGVETRAERDALVALGCDLLQGYLFARPARGFPTVEPTAFR